MYQDENKRLDEIIESTISQIQASQQDIDDISSYAKKEYIELEEEFMRLKIEATQVIDRVEVLQVELKKSRNLLLKVNKEFTKYSEKEMKSIYEHTDTLRIQLAVEQEREALLIRRRNELELHLKSIRKISEKADRLSNNFEMAYGVLSGDLRKLTQKIDDMQNKEIWGIKVIQAQELERERIARDMHDGPAQSLSNLIIKTEYCIKLLDKDIDRTKLELQSLKSLIRGTIDETRRLIYNLRPMSIDDLGLVPTLERLIDKFNDDDQEKKMNINLIVKPSYVDHKNSVTTLTVYRIVQEALNNIKKYADASRVIIELELDGSLLILSISDNGKGFNVEDVKLNLEDNVGFGLSMMKERTNLLLGEFNIASHIGKGTIITVKIPLDKGMEEENE